MNAMRKEAIERRIVLGLIAVFLISLVIGPLKTLGMWSRPRPPAPPAPPLEAPRASAAGSAQGQSDLEAVALPATPAPTEAAGRGRAATQLGLRPAEEPANVVAYAAQTLRDPLESLLPVDAASASASTQAQPIEPSTQPKAPPPSLQLQGVMWGGPQPKAIINHRVYSVGDLVDGARITSIAAQQVLLEFQGNPMSLSLSRR